MMDFLSLWEVSSFNSRHFSIVCHFVLSHNVLVSMFCAKYLKCLDYFIFDYDFLFDLLSYSATYSLDYFDQKCF